MADAAEGAYRSLLSISKGPLCSCKECGTPSISRNVRPLQRGRLCGENLTGFMSIADR